MPAFSRAARVDRVRRLSVRYRTDPKRIARLLPPPLQVDVLPDILVDYLSVAGRGLSPFSPDREEEVGWFTLHAAARHGRRRGMIVLGVITDHEWGRIQAREFLGFPAKSGEVSLSVDGLSVRASCGLDGRGVQALETTVSGRPAHPLTLWRATGFGSFVYRYAPGVDLSKAVADPPVELWRVPAGSDGGPSGPDTSEPDDSEVETGEPDVAGKGARACDISQTKFTWGAAAWADAETAMPVAEFVGAAYQEINDKQAVDWPYSESRPRQEFLSEVDPRRFAPWVLSRL